MISQNGAMSTDIGKLWAVGEYNSYYGWLYYPAHGALSYRYKCNASQVRPLLASEEID